MTDRLDRNDLIRLALILGFMVVMFGMVGAFVLFTSSGPAAPTPSPS